MILRLRSVQAMGDSGLDYSPDSDIKYGTSFIGVRMIKEAIGNQLSVISIGTELHRMASEC
jgi:hypothetical protein